ncbi:MAG TPA: hypothetical protein PLE33_05280 [Candidatus Cloacimonas sp.]|nr:hypothetical protein [Candidatus Cloacimonas sp.]HPS60656.1 hypothetical protein [Candidatus Cloacimonas sp.]
MLEIELSSPKLIPNRKLNVWSNPVFMQTVADISAFRPWHLICYKGTTIVAVLPLYEKKILGYPILKRSSLSYYQGLNLWLENDSSPARKLLDALQITTAIAKYINRNYKRYRINLTPETYDIRGFLWNKMKVIPFYTFIHNLGETLNPLPDKRRDLVLAEKQNYTFIEELNIEEFINLLKQLKAKKSWNPDCDYQGLAEFIRILYQEKILRQMNLKLDKEIVSSNLILQDGSRVYNIYQATASNALKKGASSWHTVKLIDLLQSEGFQELDFCGSSIPEIARFNSAIGLQLKLFFQIRS